MKIRVLIIDDHQILREGLRALLEGEQDFEVVGEASDGQAGVERAAELQPDVVVMDIAMPGLGGIEATRQILATTPKTRIVALSIHAEHQVVGRMIGAGAAGYVLKDCTYAELATAIRTVMKNKAYLSTGVADVMIKDYRDRVVGGASAGVLTPRETEVLRLLAEGKGTADIARKLAISVKTVETHRKQVMDKLDLHSVAELTKYAIREGLTSLDTERR